MGLAPDPVGGCRWKPFLYKKHATCQSIQVSDHRFFPIACNFFFSAWSPHTTFPFTRAHTTTPEKHTIMGFLSLKKPDDEVGAAWPSIMVGAFAAFAGILYGYDTGTISGA